MSFAFADSPQGGGEAGTPDASGGRAFLLHTAKRKRTARTVASTADTRAPLEVLDRAMTLPHRGQPDIGVNGHGAK